MRDDRILSGRSYGMWAALTLGVFMGILVWGLLQASRENEDE